MRQIILIGVGLTMLVVAGCSHRYDPYGYEAQSPTPPRPVNGYTSKGGTWTDLGGGMTVIQHNDGRRSEVLY
jgi:hypothetical protein